MLLGFVPHPNLPGYDPLYLENENEEINIIGTGGMAEMIAPYCSSIKIIDPLLTLTGLRLIYELNHES